MTLTTISHRGLWKHKKEQNSLGAFSYSFSRGFGAEIDIRDYKGILVVSHDIASARAVKLIEVLNAYKSSLTKMPLALNIKSCGLARAVKTIFDSYKIADYFVFDAATPDMLEYLTLKIPVFSRQSEYEKEPLFYSKAAGVWLDGFTSDLVDAHRITRHLASGKKVCLVSPELHKRPYMNAWAQYRLLHKKTGSRRLMLCTDHPEKARRFFSE